MPGPGLREQYEREGYLTGLRVFSSEEIDAYRQAFDALEAIEGKAHCQIGLQSRHLDERFIWDMASADSVLDLMCELVGDDLLMLSTHFFCKYPERDEPFHVAWHQDTKYWGLDPAEAHTAWIAVDRADDENGCMQVIPGSHRQGLRPHGTASERGNLLNANQRVEAGELNTDEARSLVLEPGEASIHHGHLIHGSGRNRSKRRRCGLTVRFVPTFVRQARKNGKGKMWPALLVRGEDRFGHFPKRERPFS
jgi:hypothetical protein